MIIGYVDNFISHTVCGWAFDKDSVDEHLAITVLFGDQVIATGVANTTREDLPAAGIGNGDHAFRVKIPETFWSSRSLSVVADSKGGERVGLPITIEHDILYRNLHAALTSKFDDALSAAVNKVDIMQSRALDKRGIGEILDRIDKLDQRVTDAEVFYIRIDEILRKLVDDEKKKRKRWIF